MASSRSACGAVAPWCARLGCIACAACAAVSGVDAFKSAPCAGECTAEATIDATSPPAGAGSDDARWESPDVLSVETSTDDAVEPDAERLDDAGGADGAADVAIEAGHSPTDAAEAATIDGPSIDATGDAVGDAGTTEAGEAGRCSASSCNGCCTSTGTCVPGTANPACGAAGASCQDCTTNGQACAGGACVATSCVVGSCKNTCVPYFIQCCKVDSTCGCALLFPPGPCN